MSTSTPSNRSRLERLGNFLGADPDNTRLLRDYAVEALGVGEYQASAMALQRVGGLEPLTLDDRLVLSQALRRNRQSDEALAVLAEAARTWPGDPWVALETARCHFAERAFELALDALVDAPAGDPSAEEVPALRIRLLHHLGRLDEAVAVAEGVLSAAPTGTHAGTGVGTGVVARAVLPVLIDQSRLDDAVALAGSVVEAAPAGSPSPYEVCEPFAAAALDGGDPVAARDWTRAALAQRQDDGRIWLLDGLARLAADGPAAALEALERAAALMPGHAGSHLALGWGCIAANDLGRAQAAFEEGVAADPNFAEGHGSLAVLAAMQHRRNDAETLLRKAVRLDARCASALWARHLLDGKADASEVPRLAEIVVAQARRQLRPRATRPTAS